MSPAGARRTRLALAAYAGLLLYGTLRPFDFGWRHLASPGDAARIEWVPFTRPCPTHGIFCPWDIGTNVAAFVPLGALAARAGRGGRVRRAGLAAAGGLALSAAIETAQLFLPSRFPSSLDVLCNALGALLGALAAVGLERAAAGRGT